MLPLSQHQQSVPITSASSAIMQQPHTWLEISASALNHNIDLYKSIIGNDVQLAVVVKSNAYGHGMREIASVVEQNPNANWLCCTSLSEALQLRAHGITKPLLVLAIINDDPRNAIMQDIDLVVYDLETVKQLNTLGQQLHKVVNVHIKIDSGLSRFGFLAESALETIIFINQLSHIHLRGICSHLAQAEAADQSYTQQQIARFTSLLDTLQEQNITISLRHTNNTAATTTQEAGRFNFVRIGAGIYGLQPSLSALEIAESKNPGFNTIPVMTWKTRIMYTRIIKAGSFIGYGKTYQAQTDIRAGIIPIGFYEGYDRRLSNKGIVLVNPGKDGTLGGYAPVLGRVCMNVTMIDLTHLPEAGVGDEVAVLGNHPNLYAHDIANLIQSYNSREFLVRLNTLLPRVLTT